MPLDSVVDVSALPPVYAAPPSPPESFPIKPFLTADPVGLARWREHLERAAEPDGYPAPGITIPGPEVATAAPAPRVVVHAFDGLANDDNAALTGRKFVPPDANLAVGPRHVLQMVNQVGRLWERSESAVSTFTLATFFGVASGRSAADPRVLYDAVSARWFAVNLEFSRFPAPSGASSIILAVSETSDATGSFCRYRIGDPTAEGFLQDFPMLGVSDDKVVISYNGFAFPDQSFVGAGYYVVRKGDVLACAPMVAMRRVPPALSRFTPQPAQALGSTTDLFLAMHQPAAAHVTLVTIHELFPATGSDPSRTLAIRPWTPPPPAVQAGSPVPLDTGDDRVLSASWQAHSLWVTGNEACVPPGDQVPRSCLRLIEVRTDAPAVRQDLTFGAASAYAYYPALRPDGAGHLHVVFMQSSSNAFAGVHLTGRLTSDPLNALQPAVPLRLGGGAQTFQADPGSPSRAGDYSGAALDPVDSRSVWVTGEFIRTTGPVEWGTVVAEIRFDLLLRLGLNGRRFRPGDRFRLDVTAANPHSARVVDVYLGARLPAEAGPGLGCPARDPVVFVTDPTVPTVVLTCASAPPGSFPPLLRGATLPEALPTTTVPGFLSGVWLSEAPPGLYTLFLAMTEPDALADGRVDALDVIAIVTENVSFEP